MSIGYSWRLSGAHGIADSSGVADSVQDVSDGLTAALRAAYGSHGPEVLGKVLTASWGPLRHSLLTDGVSAIQQTGRRWQGSAPGISVEVWSL